MNRINACLLRLGVLIGLTGGYANGKEINAMTDNGSIKTVCAGRLLVDVPMSAQVKLSAEYFGVEEIFAGPSNNFEKLEMSAGRRAKELNEKKMERSITGDAIDRAFGDAPGEDTAKTRLIAFSASQKESSVTLAYHVDDVTSKLKVELHRLIEGNHYILSTTNYGANRYDLINDALLGVSKRFSISSSDTIPRQPGFCVDKGIFSDKGKPEAKERFTLIVSFPNHPDVQFSIDAHAIDRANADEPSLTHRVDADLNMMRSQYSGIDVIERGALQVASQQGYQIAIGAPYDNVPGTRIRKFFWSADGVPNDVTRPFMEVDMTVQPTDDGKSTIKDDAEAKALWEQLIHSLRIRPGAV